MHRCKILTAFVASGAWACGGSVSEVEAEARIEVLAAAGPYSVGYRTFEVTYDLPLGEGTRSSTALVWYPAEAAPANEDPFYFLRTPELAKVDAPPLDIGPRPVLLVSHGHQAYPAGQSFLTEHLASHGYLVIAPTHTGNTFLDGSERETDIYYLRAFDISKTLDALRELDSSEPLGALVGEQTAIIGHSFGAYTSFMIAGARHDMDTLAPACVDGTGKGSFCSTMTPQKEALLRDGFRDPRFQAVVSLDPGDFDLFGSSGMTGVSVPTLHMVAEIPDLAPAAPELDQYWMNLDDEDDVRVLLLGGGHNDFTDSCAAGLDIRCSDLPHRPVWRLVRVYVQAFLQRVLGKADPVVDEILTGRAEVSPLAEVSLH